MRIQQIIRVFALLILGQINAFAQQNQDISVSDSTEILVNNYPKVVFDNEFRCRKSFYELYPYIRVDEMSTSEKRKMAGDLWVLKCNYKLSEDKRLLKDILIKSLAYRESIYLFLNPKSPYMLEYLRSMPEDSIFSISSLPILGKWMDAIDNTQEISFQYFKTMPLRSEKNKYFRDRFVLYGYESFWEKPSWEKYCGNKNHYLDLDTLKLSLSLDVQTYFENFKVRVLKGVYSVLENSDDSPNWECKDSLLKKYSQKILDFTEQNHVQESNYTFAKYANNIAHKIYYRPQYTELALKLVNKSLSLYESANALDTKAHILYKLDQQYEAIKVEQKAIEMCQNYEDRKKFQKVHQKMYNHERLD